MFWDYQEDNRSSSQSSCPSMTTSSFCIEAACDTADMRTPPSSRRPSMDAVKIEHMLFPVANTPEGYGFFNGMSPVSSVHEMSPGYFDQRPLFPSGGAKMLPAQLSLGFNTFGSYDNEDFGSFQFSHGLPIQTPALEMDFASTVPCMESSLSSMDFVDPSQTTFAGPFDVHSPLPLMKPLQFGSPLSDCTSDQNSPMANIAFCMQYEDCASPSTSPLRSSPTSSKISATRQPTFEQLRSSSALQQIQAQPHTVRRTRKQMHRAISSRMIPSGIRIQHAANKRCNWPGCGKKFKRSEHLKRHEWTVHDPNQRIFPCQFCNHPFNRRDNLKSHIKLHGDPVNTKRTAFFKEAQAAYDKMDRKTKKKKKAEDVVEFETGGKINARSKSRIIAH